jgi:hypothetical protein
MNMQSAIELAEDKITTPVLENLLRAKYSRDRYALFFDVPDAVSLDQRRRIDAIAFGIWRSVGRDIEGFELKVSRADWLREVKQVDKADPFIALCDYFWLVTADTKIVKLEEIPACWGWMSATKGGLRVQRPATKLPGCGDDIPREFVLGVLRRMQDDLINSPDVKAVIEERIGSVHSRIEQDVKWATQRLQREVDESRKAMADFEAKSGICLQDWRFGNVGELVLGLRKLGYGGDGMNHVPKILEQHENVLRDALKNITELRAKLSESGT